MKKLINFGIVFRSFGISISIIGFFMLFSLIWVYVYEESTAIPILISSAISLVAGQLFRILGRKAKMEDIGNREAFIIVSLTWFMAGVFGSLPFIISGAIPNFTDAYFETVSGFTTTGASILSDIEAVPKSILFWRSMTHWLGGMGILVLVIAILPSIGYGGGKLFVAEVSGPSSNKIHPKIRRTAGILWSIYLGLTIILVTLLLLGGMNIFESICHAFGAISTGGYSPKNTSIANYSSYIQIVIIVFMFFGSINFAFYFFLLKGKFKKVFSNEELLSYIALICVVSFLIGIVIFFNGNYSNFGEALKHSFFQCVSIISTTGFASADYMLWPEVTWFGIFLLFFVTGMIGSTSGGIKFTRHIVLIKNIRSEIKRIIHPHSIIPLRLNKLIIPEDVVRNFFILFVAYILVFCVGSILMSLFVETPKEAVSVTISCLSGVGPAFGKFGPVGNYSEIHIIGKWILSIIMIIGRLEIIPVFILFNISFWKK